MARVTVYFATNRQPITGADGQTIVDFGGELGPVGGLAVRYGSADVDVELGAGTALLVPDSLQVAPEQLFGPAGVAPVLGSRTVFDQLRQDMVDQKRPTLAFVHGFNNTFRDAIQNAGWIITFYGLDANMFAFSWPSLGGTLVPYESYVHDRGTAAASGPAMARTIRTLHGFVDALPDDQRCRQPIHLLCHSMGVFALRHGVQALLQLPDTTLQTAGGTDAVRPMTFVDRAEAEPVTIRRTFEQIVLVAGDEDDDAFDNPAKLKYLPRLGRAVAVYHTPKDWVLSTLSARTKFNGPRLGTDGPDNMGSISDKVSAIDVSAAIVGLEGQRESHTYYRQVPAVRDDIVAVLNGTPPDQVPNRTAVSAGRWRLAPAKPKARARARKS